MDINACKVHIGKLIGEARGAVGPDLDVLLISTASGQLTPTQLARYPDSGRLFTCRVGVTGTPVTAWSGP